MSNLQRVGDKTVATMKMYIDQNIKDYNNTWYTIEEMYILPAFEAESDTVMSNSQEPTTRSIGDRLKTTLANLLKTLQSIIEKFAVKLSNVFKRLLQSDTGFTRNCREAMVNNKPLEGVKLIVYNYNENALDSEANRFTQAVIKKMDSIKQNLVNKGEIDEDNSDDLLQNIFKEISAPADVKNLETYFSYLKDLYRKEKKETLFTAVNTNNYYQIATSSTNIRQVLDARKSKLDAYNSQVSNKLKTAINGSDLTDEQKSRLLRRSRNLGHLYNIQTHFLDIYLQLKIERVFTYRAVLKKLYHFS